jgi:hypothetical protein
MNYKWNLQINIFNGDEEKMAVSTPNTEYQVILNIQLIAAAR